MRRKPKHAAREMVACGHRAGGCRKRKRLRSGALVAVTLIAALALTASLLTWGDPRARRGYYQGKTPEEVRADLDSQVDWYAMEISVASWMTVREGDLRVEARLENVAANHCDQKVRMYPTNDPADVLFQSGALAPGEYLQFVDLAHALPVGRHAVTVEFQGYERTPSLVSDEGTILGHDRFGASCAAEVTIDVLPASVTRD